MPFLNKESKRSSALELHKAKGIRFGEAAPLLHRLLWRCGIDVPPPHFAGFWFNAGLMGGFQRSTVIPHVVMDSRHGGNLENRIL